MTNMILTIWILSVLFLVLFYLCEVLERRKRKLPPGPWPLPVIGNMHQLALAHWRPDLAIAALSAKYGEIYKLKVGLSNVVILASDEAIRYVFSKKEGMGRDIRGSLVERNKGKYSGLVLNEGANWEKIRPWTVKNLKDYGFNKTLSMEASILEDIETMFEKTDELLGSDGSGLISVEDWFTVPVFKFIWKLLVGGCSSEDEVMLTQLVLKSNEMVKNTVLGIGLVNAFPFLRFIFPNATGHKAMMGFFDESYKIAQNLLQKVQSHEIETPQNFVEAFAKKMTEVGIENKDKEVNCFTEHDFAVLFMDLVQAGSETSSSYLESLVLQMVLHPKVQAKVYEEIRKTIPPGQPVAYSYSKLMPYTQAVMLETHRHAKVLQNLLPRKALQDIQYLDYLIPKGTTILADMHTVLNCPKKFVNPERFQPERFIGTNGEFVPHQSVIPFSIGKRNCIAENVAEVSTFLFVVSILRKYEISTIRGEPVPRKDIRVGITSRPFPFAVMVSTRALN